MSKAFTKEDAGGEELEKLPKLEPWPAGVKNYMTPEHHQELVDEAEFLRSPVSNTYKSRPWRDARLNAIASRLAAAEVVPLPKEWDEESPARFGATVTILDDGIDRTYRIVGIEEANGYQNISWRSPLAKALIGKKAGDWLTLRLPEGKKVYMVFSVKYEKPKKKK